MGMLFVVDCIQNKLMNSVIVSIIPVFQEYLAVILPGHIFVHAEHVASPVIEKDNLPMHVYHQDTVIHIPQNPRNNPIFFHCHIAPTPSSIHLQIQSRASLVLFGLYHTVLPLWAYWDDSHILRYHLLHTNNNTRSRFRGGRCDLKTVSSRQPHCFTFSPAPRTRADRSKSRAHPL